MIITYILVLINRGCEVNVMKEEFQRRKRELIYEEKQCKNSHNQM